MKTGCTSAIYAPRAQEANAGKERQCPLMSNRVVRQPVTHDFQNLTTKLDGVEVQVTGLDCEDEIATTNISYSMLQNAMPSIHHKAGAQGMRNKLA